MTAQGSHFARQYLREDALPTPYCPGCGCGTVVNCFLKAVEELGHKNLDRFAFCSGIGCSSWIPSPHFRADTIHTTHGRSLAVALGLKLARPDLKVVVFGGDGDMVGIGLNHLVQSARRNLDVTAIMVNNMIYGMTGGQVAPTTPSNVKTKTTPYGSFEYPLDASRLIAAAGASYVAKWTTYHVLQTKESIKQALEHPGFSFVEIVSQCPPIYGRRVGMETAGKILNWMKENSIPITRASELDSETLAEKVLVGEYVKRDKPSLLENIQRIRRSAAP